MKKSGFILIETLIYLLLSSIFFLLLFQFTINIYSKYKNSCFSNSKYSCLCSALDLIARDIQKSSNNPNTWKKFENNSYIFSNNSLDIGWFIEKNNLYRIEGVYNKLNSSWQNEVKSLACNDIMNFQVIFNKPEYLPQTNQSKIVLVKIILESKSENKTIYVHKSVCPHAGDIAL